MDSNLLKKIETAYKDFNTPENSARRAVDTYVTAKIELMNGVDNLDAIKWNSILNESKEIIAYGNWFAEKEGLGKNYFNPENKLLLLGRYEQMGHNNVPSSYKAPNSKPKLSPQAAAA